MAFYWFCAFAGLLITVHRSYGLVLFLVLVFLAVMFPASLSHWVGARLRFPLDLLYMPFTAIFVDKVITSRSELYKVLKVK